MATNQRGNRVDFRNKRDIPGPSEISQFRFLVPTKAATIIIGKGGERVQRLTVDCSCRLTIVDSPGPERVFVVEGALEGCLSVWSECFMDLLGVMGGRIEGEVDLRWLCHSSVVGAIIGKGGMKVKDMKTSHGLSTIKVHQEMAPMSSDRVIQMVGEPERVVQCFRAMYSELAGLEIRGPIEMYRAENSDNDMAMLYGGWPGRMPMESGMDGFGTRPPMDGYGVRPPMDGYGPRQPMGGYGGFPGRHGDADDGMDFGGARGHRPEEWPLIMAGPQRHQYPEPERGPTPNKRTRPWPESAEGGQQRWYGAPRAASRTAAASSNSSADLSVAVSVPAPCLSTPRGLGGERLHNIMEDSGAEIAVAPEGGSVLTLKGTRDQVEGAQYLMQMCVKRYLLNL